ncbi:hypothetical protein [Erysipelothrix rhusiopathiae]|uniref:hypothetical protein n=1 Tax=Erysipelothrix rhusiopathiae TaxID=1648 RepID=UPI0039ECF1CE
MNRKELAQKVLSLLEESLNASANAKILDEALMCIVYDDIVNNSNNDDNHWVFETWFADAKNFIRGGIAPFSPNDKEKSVNELKNRLNSIK